MNSYRNLLCVIFFLAIATSCHEEKTDFKFATSVPSSSYTKTGTAIAKVLRDESYFDIEILTGPNMSVGENCEDLLQKKIDLAFAQNDTDISQLLEEYRGKSDVKIRTLIPVYPEIVFILYPDSLKPTSLEDLVSGRNIGLGPKRSGTAQFMGELFDRFGIDTSLYNSVYTPYAESHLENPAIDIACFVSGFYNKRIEMILEKQNGKIYSLGDHRLANQGSTVDGFCIKYPRARPFIIPKNMMGNIPKEPVLTLAIDAVILTRDDIPNNDIYYMVEAIYNNAQLLAKETELLSGLDEGFNTRQLNFPIHEGVRMFLERNQPSVYERYLELLGILFSIIVVFAGLVPTLRHRAKMRKKNRIDDYYIDVIKYEKDYDSMTAEQCIVAIQAIRDLKSKAFNQLVAEELVADESFQIFVNLTNDTIALLEKKVME